MSPGFYPSISELYKPQSLHAQLFTFGDDFRCLAKAGPLGCDFIPVITAPRQAGTKGKSLLAFVSGVRVPKDSLSQLTDHFTPVTRGQEGDLAAALGPALHPLSSRWFNSHENPNVITGR